MVIGQVGVGALPEVRHEANSGDGANIVIPPFDPPSGHCGIVYGATHGQVSFDIPLQIIEYGPLSVVPLHDRRVVVDVIEEGEPMPRRGL